ncbi:MAG: hypothetical protein NQU46_02075 [Methanolinea sp.]|nr:hypothetical protein [Methanolinea sp.]
MKRDLVILLVLGLFACVALYVLVDIYVSLIAAVLVIALAMSVFIMQDSAMKPNVMVFVEENTKGIRVRNRGNARALSVSVSVEPLGLSFTIPVLEEDAVTTFPTPPITDRIRVTVSYKNEAEVPFSKTVTLMPHDIEDEDLLKPTFPLFGWK